MAVTQIMDEDDNRLKINTDRSINVNANLVGSLANQTLAESSKTEADAVAGVVTFSADVDCIEIYNSDAVNTGTFNVNGIDVVVPPSKVWKDAIGGTPSAEVTIAGATTYILNRFV